MLKNTEKDEITMQNGKMVVPVRKNDNKANDKVRNGKYIYVIVYDIILYK